MDVYSARETVSLLADVGSVRCNVGSVRVVNHNVIFCQL